MNHREKMLAGIVGGMAALFAIGLGLKHLFVSPLKELDNQTQVLREKLGQIQEERRAYFSAEDYLKKMAQRSFGSDADTASAEAGKMIGNQINRLNLEEAEFSRQPVGPRKFRGAQEVGWSVQGEGPLGKMIDFLFVLEQTPQVHRLENLVVSAGSRPGWIKARFRYLTLVVDSVIEMAKTNLPPLCELDSPQRRSYDALVQRDLLRPYVRRSASLEMPRNIVDSTPGSTQPELLKVASLSQWQGVVEVHICDLASQKVTRYRPGDDFLGGKIVMVDYRPLPLPSQPELLSYGRVIIQIGDEYWAVEQGQTLSSKYRLSPEQLPPELSKS